MSEALDTVNADVQSPGYGSQGPQLPLRTAQTTLNATFEQFEAKSDANFTVSRRLLELI